MSCSKAEDSEVNYEEVDPKQVHQINTYQQVPFNKEGNWRKKIPTARIRCSIIIAVVLSLIFFNINSYAAINGLRDPADQVNFKWEESQQSGSAYFRIVTSIDISDEADKQQNLFGFCFKPIHCRHTGTF